MERIPGPLQGAGDELVVGRLVLHLLLVFPSLNTSPAPEKGLCSRMLISLKVSQYFTRPSNASEAGAGVAGEEGHHPPGFARSRIRSPDAWARRSGHRVTRASDAVFRGTPRTGPR